MIKKGFIFLLCLISGLFISSTIKAVEDEGIINLVDLNNIYLDGDQQKRTYRPSERMLYMKDYVDVELNSNYTVVIHQFFYEQDFDSRNFSESEFDLNLLYSDNQTEQVPFNMVINQLETNNDYVWATFKAIGNKVKINGIKTRVNNVGNEFPFKIIMFKGEITDFEDFYSFKSNYETSIGNLIVNVDDPLSINEIANLISSGNNVVTISKDDYSSNKDKIGSYLIKFVAKDEYVNASFLSLHVHVVDIVKPIISGKNTYDVNINEVNDFSLNEVKNSLEVSDNYSNLTTSDLIVVSDTFTPNKTKSGSYQVIFRVKDSSGNQSDFPVTINVVDNNPPILTGPMEIFRYSTDPKLTLAAIKAMYTAYDDVDGDLSDKIIVSGNIETTPGKYEIIISVKDNSGNEAYRKLFLKIVDGIPPSFTTSSLILTNEQYNNMTNEDIINWLEEQLSGNVSNITIVHDEKAYSKEGKYVYFSYEEEGRVLHGRIEIINKTSKTLLILTLSGGLLVISGIVSIFIIKKRKH